MTLLWIACVVWLLGGTIRLLFLGIGAYPRKLVFHRWNDVFGMLIQAALGLSALYVLLK